MLELPMITAQHTNVIWIMKAVVLVVISSHIVHSRKDQWDMMVQQDPEESLVIKVILDQMEKMVNLVLKVKVGRGDHPDHKDLLEMTLIQHVLHKDIKDRREYVVKREMMVLVVMSVILLLKEMLVHLLLVLMEYQVYPGVNGEKGMRGEFGPQGEREEPGDDDITQQELDDYKSQLDQLANIVVAAIILPTRTL